MSQAGAMQKKEEPAVHTSTRILPTFRVVNRICPRGVRRRNYKRISFTARTSASASRGVPIVIRRKSFISG
jgi:hypothetical protein